MRTAVVFAGMTRLADGKMRRPQRSRTVPNNMLRSTRALVAIAISLAAVTGCAVNHSENFVSLVMTKDVGQHPVALTNVEIVVQGGLFGDVTTKGKTAPGMEMIANRQLASLLPALRQQLPAVLRRNGITVRSSPTDPHSAADQVMTVTPQLATQSSGGTWVSPNGNNGGVGIQLLIDIRGRDGGLIWRGTALERASTLRPDSMQWDDAMAEDLARTLLIRLRTEGLVKLGPNGQADPI